MTRVIERLLERAADECAGSGIVPADTQMSLAAEGYCLCALDGDIQTILERN